jgi:hypothetical protein
MQNQYSKNYYQKNKALIAAKRLHYYTVNKAEILQKQKVKYHKQKLDRQALFEHHACASSQLPE